MRRELPIALKNEQKPHRSQLRIDWVKGLAALEASSPSAVRVLPSRVPPAMRGDLTQPRPRAARALIAVRHRDLRMVARSGLKAARPGERFIAHRSRKRASLAQPGSSRGESPRARPASSRRARRHRGDRRRPRCRTPAPRRRRAQRLTQLGAVRLRPLAAHPGAHGRRRSRLLTLPRKNPRHLRVAGVLAFLNQQHGLTTVVSDRKRPCLDIAPIAPSPRLRGARLT